MIYDSQVFWQMAPWERICFLYALNQLPEKIQAVEIGSFCGGTLQHLSRLFGHVYSLDLTHQKTPRYNNVTYLTGKSQDTFKLIGENINDTNLFFVDGDHSYEAVLKDLVNIVRYLDRQQPVMVMIHDSAYEEVRRAVSEINWKNHTVYLDYCIGDKGHGGLIVIQNEYVPCM